MVRVARIRTDARIRSGLWPARAGPAPLYANVFRSSEDGRAARRFDRRRPWPRGARRRSGTADTRQQATRRSRRHGRRRRHKRCDRGDGHALDSQRRRGHRAMRDPASGSQSISTRLRMTAPRQPFRWPRLAHVPRALAHRGRTGKAAQQTGAGATSAAGAAFSIRDVPLLRS